MIASGVNMRSRFRDPKAGWHWQFGFKEGNATKNNSILKTSNFDRAKIRE
jgi:hypothetical protein